MCAMQAEATSSTTTTTSIHSTTALDDLIAREWITTNRLGGFASSTLAGLNTRKYHGLLVAAMAPPVRRMVILSRIEETVLRGGQSWPLAACEYPGTISPAGHANLRAFDYEPYPRWAYQGDGWTIARELRLLRGKNTVLLGYTLLGATDNVELELRPLLALRGIHELMFQWGGRLNAERVPGRTALYRIPPTSRSPEVFFAHDGTFDGDAYWYLNNTYRRETERGYAGLEDLWMPGIIRCALRPGQTVYFACSTEPLDLSEAVEEAARQHAQPPPAAPGIVEAISSPEGESHIEPLARLVRAAEAFLVTLPASAGQGNACALTGLPWSAPNCRDALIGFTGLFLVTRRFDEARRYLFSLAAQLNGGLIPTTWPEDGTAPQYGGADTSLWFIHAVHQYVRYSTDSAALTAGLLEAGAKILRRYRECSAGLGIQCESEGLISSRVPGMATTWMDAKVGDWVITPRQGRPVELNALWYNALRVVAKWDEELGQPERGVELAAFAARVKSAFNEAFWNSSAECCHDVVMDHGVDASIRPNQVVAMSLPYAVLEGARFDSMLEVLKARLLTPVGLRTLSPEDPAYQGRCGGDVVARDRAVHQGAAHPWLLGHFVAASLKARGRSTFARRAAAECIESLIEHLSSGPACGQLPELFEGDAPHATGGAIASARSVGEVLRCYVEDVLNATPEALPTASKPTQLRPPVHR